MKMSMSEQPWKKPKEKSCHTKKRDIRRGEKRAEGEKRRVEGAYRIENHLSVRAQTEFAMRIKFPANPKKIEKIQSK